MHLTSGSALCAFGRANIRAHEAELVCPTCDPPGKDLLEGTEGFRARSVPERGGRDALCAPHVVVDGNLETNENDYDCWIYPLYEERTVSVP